MSRRVIMTTFGACLIFVASACGSPKEPVITLPQIYTSQVKIKVTARYPGHTQEEVESLLVKPISKRLNQVPGLSSQSVVIVNDSCAVVLMFSHEVHEADALAAVEAAMADTTDLPADLPRRPQVSPYRHPKGSIFHYIPKANPSR